MTVRLSHSSLTGTERTDVAVGTAQRGVHVLGRRGGDAAQHGVGRLVAGVGRGLPAWGPWRPGLSLPAAASRRRRCAGRGLATGFGPRRRLLLLLLAGFCSCGSGLLGAWLRLSAGFAGAFSGALAGCLGGGLGGGPEGVLPSPFGPTYRCRRSSAPTPAPRCSDPAGTARTSPRRATRWPRSLRRSRGTGCLGTAARSLSPLPVCARGCRVLSRLVAHARKCAAASRLWGRLAPDTRPRESRAHETRPPTPSAGPASLAPALALLPRPGWPGRAAATSSARRDRRRASAEPSDAPTLEIEPVTRLGRVTGQLPRKDAQARSRSGSRRSRSGG